MLAVGSIIRREFDKINKDNQTEVDTTLNVRNGEKYVGQTTTNKILTNTTPKTAVSQQHTLPMLTTLKY